nr:reverse transcriptase domain-containing protein [Tanacetum cinerariifolium]
MLLQSRVPTIKEVTDTIFKETQIIMLATKWDHPVFLLRMCKTIKTTIGSGSLSSNTVANSRGDVKAITTRSGVAYDGPAIPPTPSPIPKEVECETEVTKDKVQNTSPESTEHVQPLVVQVPILEPDDAPKTNSQP